MDTDLMIRTIGRVDKGRLSVFLHRVADMTGSASTMKITTPAGCDLEFEIEPKHKLSCDDGSANVPACTCWPDKFALYQNLAA